MPIISLMMFGFLTEREFRRLVLMWALVFACSLGSNRLSLDAGGVSCIWISNGVISAFVLTAPPSWKARFFVVGRVTNLAVDLLMGDPFLAAGWYAICNASEVLITVLPFRHFADRSAVNTQLTLCRIAFPRTENTFGPRPLE